MARESKDREAPFRSSRSLAGRFSRPVLLILIAVFVWLSILTEPKPVVGDGRDGSWIEAYSHFMKHRSQAGRNYCFTYGPLGHFAVQGFDEELYWRTYAFELLFKGAIAAIVVSFATTLGNIWRTLLFCAVTAGPLLLMGQVVDGLFVLTIALEFSQLSRGAAPLWRIAAFGLIAATLGLMKFTLLVFGAAAIVLLTFDLILRNRALVAWLPAVSFAGFLAIWWAVLGQSFVNVPVFLQTSWEVASGYTAAMGRAGDRGTLVLGVFAFAAFLGIVIPRNWRESRISSFKTFLPLLLLVAAALFLSWKHAFIRADHGHTIGFFWIATPLVFVLPGALPAYDWRNATRLCLVGACAALSLFGVASIARQLDGISLVRSAPKHLRRKVSYVLAPSARRAELAAHRTLQATAFALPEICEHVGKSAVDLISDAQGVLFLNELNWTPRPVFQSYAACTPKLLSLNGEFFRRDSAPRFALLRLRPIDDRFPAMEDGDALRAILHQYRPTMSERGYALFERIAGNGSKPIPMSDEPLTIPFDETAALSSNPNEYTTVELAIVPTRFARGRQFLYRAPFVNLEITMDEGSRVFRMIPEMAASEFILSPFVTDTASFLNLYEAGTAQAVRAFRITSEGADNFEPQVRVRLRRYARPTGGAN